MRDWAALEEAAGALRRLNRAVAGRDLADDALRELATMVDELAAELEARPRRDKGEDMATLGDLAAAMAGQPLTVAVGERLEFDPFSAGGGRLHPASVGIDARRGATWRWWPPFASTRCSRARPAGCTAASSPS